MNVLPYNSSFYMTPGQAWRVDNLSPVKSWSICKASRSRFGALLRRLDRAMAEAWRRSRRGWGLYMTPGRVEVYEP